MKNTNRKRSCLYKVKTFIQLFSNKEGEIERFLRQFYSHTNSSFSISSSQLEWEQAFENPIEMAEMIGVFMDNLEDFQINMWICLDENMLINVTKNNVDDLIRYLYERFPY